MSPFKSVNIAALSSAVEPESVTKSACNVLNIAALSTAVDPERVVMSPERVVSADL